MFFDGFSVFCLDLSLFDPKMYCVFWAKRH